MVACRQPPIRPVPGHEAVERGQDVGGGQRRIDRRERARLDALGDGRAEPAFVRVAPSRDVIATLRVERAPLVDEDAGALDVVGDDADVRADERDEVDARAEHDGARIRRPRPRPRRLRTAPPCPRRSTTGRPASRRRARTGWRPGCRRRGRCRARSSPSSRVRGTASWRRPRSRGDAWSRPSAAWVS